MVLFIGETYQVALHATHQACDSPLYITCI